MELDNAVTYSTEYIMLRRGQTYCCQSLPWAYKLDGQSAQLRVSRKIGGKVNFLAWLPNRLAIEMELNVGTIEPFLILQDTTYRGVGRSQILVGQNTKILKYWWSRGVFTTIIQKYQQGTCPFASLVPTPLQLSLVNRVKLSFFLPYPYPSALTSFMDGQSILVIQTKYEI